MNLASELKERGLIEHEGGGTAEEILGETRTVYFGSDPTADSLHVGHLLGLLFLRRLAAAGHRVVLLVGGGTGMIGDPKEKGERPLLSAASVRTNANLLREQVSRIVGKRVPVVNNADWLLKEKLIDFLRDTGKHFTVNELIKRDTIKRRLATEDDGISYTEFTYALLQGFDYLHLHQTRGVDLQVGGSDQWTNILSGVELIRRRLGRKAYALTTPLVTDASGKKFGKTEGNAVWLSSAKTSPFAFYQFWYNLPDEGLARYFRYYSFKSLPEIDALMEEHAKDPSLRTGQAALALEMTAVVHGEKAAEVAERVSGILFAGGTLAGLTTDARRALMASIPKATVGKTTTLGAALMETELASSKSDASRLIAQGGVTVGGLPGTNAAAALPPEAFTDGLALLRKGKREVALLLWK